MIAKRWVLRGFLGIEVFLFFVFYLMGSSGIKAITLRTEENEKLQKEIVAIEADIKNLEIEIAVWQTDPFYKERVAREQLQMARPTDEVYIVV